MRPWGNRALRFRFFCQLNSPAFDPPKGFVTWEQGYDVRRKRTGCDFEATRYNPLTETTEHIYVESKSSPTAPMRPLQKKMQKKKKVGFIIGFISIALGAGLYYWERVQYYERAPFCLG
jgi:hypothetical protein